MIQMAILVFFARIIDVSLGTLKFKAMVRGNKVLSAAIAFFEVTIYTLAAAQAFKYISDWRVLLGFAFGYALGSFIGMFIDEKISNDHVFVLIVTERNEWTLADSLRDSGYTVTTAKGYGLNGAEKAQLKIILPRKNIPELSKAVNEFDDSAFIVTMDVKDVNRMGVQK